MTSVEQREFERDMETFVDMYEAAQNIKESAQHIPQQRKACNNAVKVQCLCCGEWFINIDGCPNGCRAGVTTAIA